MAMDGLSLMSTSSQHHHGDAGDYYPRKLGPKPDVVPSGVTERKLGPLGDHHHHHHGDHHHHHGNTPDMVSVDVLNLQHHHHHHDSEVPMHRKKQEQDTYVLGTIHPFRRTHRSLFGKMSQEFRLVTSDRRSWRILLFGVLNLLCTGCLLMWCNSTNSMALTAYTYLTIFDLFSLITCLISTWVSMKKASQVYSFGFERLEVLAVFASTVLVQLGALFILKESVERLMQQPEIHTGRLLVGTFVALFFNLLTLLSVRNKPFTNVSEAASSSWLQEHVADISRSVCGIIPGLSSVLLPRMNPFVLVNLAGALSLCFTYTLIEINNYTMVDTASAVAIALMIFGTMYPMSVYSGKVLLQTNPSHVIGQLEKLLREVSTLDGVLEVRNEHFWTVGFGSLCGSVHVRVRRDANDQMVLAHVSTRLLSLVSTLTVHVFKDAASSSVSSSVSSSSSSHLHLHPNAPPSLAAAPPSTAEGGGAYKPPAYHHHHHPPAPSPDPLTSTPFKQSSPPPEFSFNSPGRNAQPVLLSAAPHQHHPPHRPYGGLPYAGGVSPYAGGPLGGPPPPPGGMMMSSQSYRTAPAAAPLRFGTTGTLLGSQTTTTPPSQYRQYQP